MIADAEGAVAVAGVMGGANSEVDEGTTDIFLECALFEPKTVRRTRSRLVLSTDASYRFERGVDPEGQPVALERVVELIVAVAGGTPAEAFDLNPRPWERRVVALRPERVKRVLGAGVTPAETETLLEEIGFEVDPDVSPIRVVVPGFRGDVEEEIDLIEEIARRRGYDSFPDELAPFRPSSVPEAPVVEVERRFAERFVGWGFLEARTTGFVPESVGEVRVLNPLSTEEGFLRTSLVPGLLRRVEHNFAHGVRDVRLFEIGAAFRAGPAGGMPHEERRVAAAFSGARAPRHWTGEAGAYEAWDLKGMLEELVREYPDARVDVLGAGFTVVGPDGSLGVGGRARGSMRRRGPRRCGRWSCAFPTRRWTGAGSATRPSPHSRPPSATWRSWCRTPSRPSRWARPSWTPRPHCWRGSRPSTFIQARDFRTGRAAWPGASASAPRTAR